MEKEESSDVYRDFSEFYDMYVGDWVDDLPFYLKHARASRTPVLEIGAGSGRLTIPMARAGIPVVAADISRSMLDILESRLGEQPPEVRERVRVVEADACHLELGDRYDLIMVPFYTFNYFLTQEAQKAALERIHGHLSDGGLALIDVFIPWSRLEHCPPDPLLRMDTVDSSTGDRVRGWNVYTLDEDNQMEHRRHIIEITRPDGAVHEREFTVHRRYFFPGELESLFSVAGFSVEQTFSGYCEEAPQADSEQLVYVLKRD